MWFACICCIYLSWCKASLLSSSTYSVLFFTQTSHKASSCSRRGEKCLSEHNHCQFWRWCLWHQHLPKFFHRSSLHKLSAAGESLNYRHMYHILALQPSERFHRASSVERKRRKQEVRQIYRRELKQLVIIISQPSGASFKLTPSSMCCTVCKVIRTHSVVGTCVPCEILVTLDFLRLEQCVDFSLERKTNVGLTGVIAVEYFQFRSLKFIPSVKHL